MADLEQLLEKTSRTFALAIPLLPEPTRREVTLAYLLFRIADTFEDGELWPTERRLQALEDFDRLLQHPDAQEAQALAQRWTAQPPVTHAGYLELLAHTPAVLEALQGLSPGARHQVAHHTRRTALGMAQVVRRTGADGQLRLGSLPELRDYCYTVAGIVGELLTELFLLGRERLHRLEPYLRERAADFGEGLQLINILKDSEADARDKRRYLPGDVPRASLFALARANLSRAGEYTQALQEAGAERGVVAFCALPVLLGRATLERLEEAGPGATISRQQVAALYQGLEHNLELGLPALQAAPQSLPVG